MNDRNMMGIYVVLGAFVLWLAGFVCFCIAIFSYVHQQPKATDKPAGIAVLTGGRHRIAKGLELLETGQGKRLLLSGVQKGVRLNEIAQREKVRIYDDMPVDLGYKATTTVGNANEIKAWADRYRFEVIYAVTSFYHIPRSRLELKKAMPDKDIRFVAVNSEYISPNWWKNFGTFKFLAAEYCKFLIVWIKHLSK